MWGRVFLSKETTRWQELGLESPNVRSVVQRANHYDTAPHLVSYNRGLFVLENFPTPLSFNVRNSNSVDCMHFLEQRWFDFSEQRWFGGRGKIPDTRDRSCRSLY